MEIRSVGYVGVGAPDPRAWLEYGTKILGMMPARAVPGESWGIPTGPTVANPGPASGGRGVDKDGSVYLKLDDRQWRVAVHRSDQNRGLHYLGLEVASTTALDEAVAELLEQGIAVEKGSATDAQSRAVTGLARFKDPVGNQLELFFGPTLDYNFHSPVANTRFLAGHLGFGHMILFVKDMAASLDFYTRILGFQVSDYIRFGPERSLQFLRCNARHHSIGLADLGIPGGLHHVMFEVGTSDEVGMALDRVNKAGIEVTASLGRHRNDRMLSFYMRSPSGFGIEIGCEGLLLDDTWTSNEFCEGDIWGHHGIVQNVQKPAE